MSEQASAAVTPGQLIQRRLEARGWSQRTLSVVLDIGESSVTRLLNGKQTVDAKLAVALEDVLDLPAEQLLHLQASHALASARAAKQEDSVRALRARLYGELPLRDMIKRGWIEASDVRDTVRIDTALIELFGLACVSAIGELAPAGGDVSPGTLARLAWLARVRQLGASIEVGPYSSEGVSAAICSLRALLDKVESVAEVPALLAEHGIRLVMVEALPGMQIDAACLWRDHWSPMIALSLSDDRIDRFWFLLRHQLEHVLRHTSCVLPCCDAGDAERAADTAAAEFCVPTAVLDDFIARRAPFIARGDIIAFARSLDVHPGIVAGRVQQRTGRHEGFGGLIAKVRGTLATSAIADGWGQRPVSPANARQLEPAMPSIA